jgi:hypothetical protein
LGGSQAFVFEDENLLTMFFQRRDTRHGHPASDTLKSLRL